MRVIRKYESWNYIYIDVENVMACASLKNYIFNYLGAKSND